jgi:hypothetical protein
VGIGLGLGLEALGAQVIVSEGVNQRGASLRKTASRASSVSSSRRQPAQRLRSQSGRCRIRLSWRSAGVRPPQIPNGRRRSHLPVRLLSRPPSYRSASARHFTANRAACARPASPACQELGERLVLRTSGVGIEQVGRHVAACRLGCPLADCRSKQRQEVDVGRERVRRRFHVLRPVPHACAARRSHQRGLSFYGPLRRPLSPVDATRRRSEPTEPRPVAGTMVLRTRRGCDCGPGAA